MTRNKNETPEQREKRLEKQKLYYLKRKAAGSNNSKEDQNKIQGENMYKKRNTALRLKVHDMVEQKIFEKTLLKIPIPPSVRKRIAEKKENNIDYDGTHEHYDYLDEVNEILFNKVDVNKQNFDNGSDITEDDANNDDDFAGETCDICKKESVSNQYTSLKTNELSETLKILLPEDVIDDIIIKVCPSCKINTNKSCLF